MREVELFTEILKATPDNSFVETSGFVDYDTAEQLGLIRFENFRPKSVGLAFNLTSLNREFWIEYFKNNDFTQDLVHYWIYYNDSIIGTGFDFFESNDLNKNYYKDKLSGFTQEFEINFEENITSGIPEPKRLLELIETHEYHGNYSLDIITKITDKNLKLRFAIDKTDFDCLTLLFVETLTIFKVEFQGLHMKQDKSVSCGLRMSGNSLKIDLWIDMTQKFISNLLWFLQLDNEKEVEQMIL
jgi:hypothetical protein